MPQILKVIFGLPSFNPISTSSPFFLPLWPRPIDSVAGRESRVPSILVEWKEEKGVSEGGRDGGTMQRRRKRRKAKWMWECQTEERGRESGLWTSNVLSNDPTPRNALSVAASRNSRIQ